MCFDERFFLTSPIPKTISQVKSKANHFLTNIMKLLTILSFLSIIISISISQASNIDVAQIVRDDGSDTRCPDNRFCLGKDDGNYDISSIGYDGNNYVACVSGLAYCMPCPEDLIFDQTSNRCEYRNEKESVSSIPALINRYDPSGERKCLSTHELCGLPGGRSCCAGLQCVETESGNGINTVVAYQCLLIGK